MSENYNSIKSVSARAIGGGIGGGLGGYGIGELLLRSDEITQTNVFEFFNALNPEMRPVDLAVLMAVYGIASPIGHALAEGLFNKRH